MTFAERYADRIMPEPNSGCWLWTGDSSPKEYGQVMVDGRRWRAHRLSYASLHGEIAAGLMICHRCDTPSCVNPDHLFLGTAKDNATDMARKGRQPLMAKTHCKHGHEFTPENTYIRPASVVLSRDCRECRRINHRTLTERRRARRVAEAA